MCLSTVYAIVDGKENKVCEYVCNVRIDGTDITLTDVMGSETKVKGTLKSCDFVKNQIVIQGA